MKKVTNPYEDLANAIILQAVKDYRQALISLQKHTKNTKAQSIKKDVERFFLSGWFVELTDLDGQMLLNKLQKEANFDEK